MELKSRRGIRPLGLASRALIVFHQSRAVKADPRADRASADHQYRMASGRVGALKRIHQVAAAAPVQHAHVVVPLTRVPRKELLFRNLSGARFDQVETTRSEQAGHKNRRAKLPGTPRWPGHRVRWKR